MFIEGNFAVSDRPFIEAHFFFTVMDDFVDYLVDQASLTQVSRYEMLKNRGFEAPLDPAQWVCWSLRPNCELERTDEDAFLGKWSVKVTKRFVI